MGFLISHILLTISEKIYVNTTATFLYHVIAGAKVRKIFRIANNSPKNV